MEHTFKCGIVGRSNDAVGDEFLAGMIMGNELDQAPIRRIEKQLAEASAVRRDRDTAVRIITLLVVRLGKDVFIPDDELMDLFANPKAELVNYRDERRRGICLHAHVK